MRKLIYFIIALFILSSCESVPDINSPDNEVTNQVEQSKLDLSGLGSQVVWTSTEYRIGNTFHIKVGREFPTSYETMDGPSSFGSSTTITRSNNQSAYLNLNYFDSKKGTYVEVEDIFIFGPNGDYTDFISEAAYRVISLSKHISLIGFEIQPIDINSFYLERIYIVSESGTIEDVNITGETYPNGITHKLDYGSN